MDNHIKLSNILYKSELLKLCEIQGEAPECFKKYSLRSIKECITCIKEYLQHADIIMQAVSSVSSTRIYKMSARQMSAALACSESILKNDWASALHEFYDCIEDYGSGHESGRELDYDEILVYHLLINNFLQALENSRQT